jgi:excinuclease ABC subunit C
MLDHASIIKNLPHQPGVYRYYDQNGVLLYVGKAKDLKKRVSSYFQKGRPKNERLSLMISQIAKIEFTVVDSEKESLILEANLIQSLQPKYNVLLRDDKSYVYVRITRDPIPGIFITRRKYDPQSRYFGPYTRQAGIVEVLRTLRSIFPYCEEKKQKSRPCSYYSIGLCEGICVGQEDKVKYQQKIEKIASILEGKTDTAITYIKDQISSAVKREDFALAALWRNRLKVLDETLASQKVVLPVPQDLDIVTLVIQSTPEGLKLGSVFVQNIRDGRIINVSNFLLTDTHNELEENDKKTTEDWTDWYELKNFERTDKFGKKNNLKPEQTSSSENRQVEHFQMLYKFLSSYYSLKTDVPKIMLQIWEKD